MSELTPIRKSTRASKLSRQNYNLKNWFEEQLPPEVEYTPRNPKSPISHKRRGRPKKVTVDSENSIESNEIDVEECLPEQDNEINQSIGLVNTILSEGDSLEILYEVKSNNLDTDSIDLSSTTQTTQESQNDVIVINSSKEIDSNEPDPIKNQDIAPTLSKPIHPFFTKIKPLAKGKLERNEKSDCVNHPEEREPKPVTSTHPFFLSPKKQKELTEIQKKEKVQDEATKRLALIQGMNRGKIINPFFCKNYRAKSPSPTVLSPNPIVVSLMEPLLPSGDQHIDHVPKRELPQGEYPPLKRRTISEVHESANFNLLSPKLDPIEIRDSTEIFMLPEAPIWWDDIVLPVLPSSIVPNPNQFTWSSKYSPTQPDQFLANFEPIRLLEVWLKRWKIKKSLTDQDNEFDEAYIYSSLLVVDESEEDDDFQKIKYNKKTKGKGRGNTTKKKQKIKAGFPETDNVPYYWTSLETVMVIEGAARSGKTSIVHASARAMDFQVVELHPGMLRSSKGVQQCIGEISKTHLVGVNGRSNVAIFINHADVLFPIDHNFWQALEQIVKHSKRPIILSVDQGFQIPTDCKLNIQDRLLLSLMDSNTLSSWIQCVALREGILLNKSDVFTTVHSLNQDVNKILNQLQSVSQAIKFHHTIEISCNQSVEEAISRMGIELEEDHVIPDYEGTMSRYVYIPNTWDCIQKDVNSENMTQAKSINREITLDEWASILNRQSDYATLTPHARVDYCILEPEICLQSHSLSYQLEDDLPSSTKLTDIAVSQCVYPNFITHPKDECNGWNSNTLKSHYDIIRPLKYDTSLKRTESTIHLEGLRDKITQFYKLQDNSTRMTDAQWWLNYGTYLNPIITHKPPQNTTFGRGMRRPKLHCQGLELDGIEEAFLNEISLKSSDDFSNHFEFEAFE